MPKDELNDQYDRKYTPGFDGKILSINGKWSYGFSAEFKDWMFNFQNKKCGYCGDFIGDTWRENKNANVEHVCNRRLGGCDVPPNLVYSCRSCNTMKGRHHYSVLKIKIPMRRAGINKVISHTKCQKLIDMGLINIVPLSSLYFEDMKWPHVDGDYYEYDS